MYRYIGLASPPNPGFAVLLRVDPTQQTQGSAQVEPCLWNLHLLSKNFQLRVRGETHSPWNLVLGCKNRGRPFTPFLPRKSNGSCFMGVSVWLGVPQ